MNNNYFDETKFYKQNVKTLSNSSFEHIIKYKLFKVSNI